MATRKTTSRRTAKTAAVPKCSTCGGTGETSETVRVGARKGRETDSRQSALCGSCFGTGTA
ncbi:hypothetical protein QCN29_31090 [Streptomyces sp. HNM0663]|uniref:Molecular chaperone DnaJ n=1 Tax=Streptomyces chengmaiensis TaxID=3040919 RepID=A0ABT6HYM7_9ACTN|nr:hypothetical protein [Streptomyces chengmaiensis]MDH2393144.1 hypothetical protein [Streptomyces chengmaiensis]